jgi:thiol-disulfide isomerase/thioredoxin
MVWYHPQVSSLLLMRTRLVTLGIVSLALLSACTPEQDQAIKNIMDDGGECVIGGCSGQLCIEEGDDGVSTCEFREEYRCFGFSRCERQTSGACGWTETPEFKSCWENGGVVTLEKEARVPPALELAATRSMYSLYAPEVLMDGQTKVLFFHAAWCPVCRKADTTLRDLYNRGDDATMTFEELMEVLPQYSVYKVDYDTETELKAKYGVTYQHTYVLVDGQGNALKTVQGPTDAALKELIGAPS